MYASDITYWTSIFHAQYSCPLCLTIGSMWNDSCTKLTNQYLVLIRLILYELEGAENIDKALHNLDDSLLF